MKIIDHDEFMKLPKYTVFTMWGPCSVEGLFLKTSEGDTNSCFNCFDLLDGIDAESSDESILIQLEMEKTGRQVKYHPSHGHDLFKDFQKELKFKIFEPDDVREMIRLLSLSL